MFYNILHCDMQRYSTKQMSCGRVLRPHSVPQGRMVPFFRSKSIIHWSRTWPLYVLAASVMFLSAIFVMFMFAACAMLRTCSLRSPLGSIRLQVSLQEAVQITACHLLDYRRVIKVR